VGYNFVADIMGLSLFV